MKKRNEGKNMIKKEKIVITIALVVSCITATPVAAKNVENNTLLEPGGIDHLESDRNSQFELNRNSQCTLAN